jgi:penicillin-binding protein 2
MRAYRDDQKLINFRINLVTWGVVFAFVFLAGAFWYVQGLQAEKFRALSESNALRQVVVRAKRGLIMDRNGQILADNAAAYQLMLMRSDLRSITRTDPTHRERMIRFVAETLGITPEQVESRIERGSKIPFNQPIPLTDDLSVEEVAAFESQTMIFPALSIETVQRRNYRYGSMAAHVLGYIGEADEKILEARPELRMGDLIGRKGVELVYDDFLRGVDGARYMMVNTHGRQISEYPVAAKEPVAGRNVYVTIDFELQRRAEQYFIENEMVGAAVALDPRNGEILAMASSPMYDPNVFSRRFTPDTWKAITSNPFHMMQNRAIQGLYSPGSVFKAVMGLAGLEAGKITPSTTFNCGGSGVFHGRRFRCWKREGHGAVNLARAMKVSCDIYFYNVGSLLGVDGINKYATDLTFGESTKIDLEGEKPGLVPSTTWAREKQNRKWYPSETISVAIGQGPLLVTALQTATMMAAIANSGTVYRPHVLKAVDDFGPDGRPLRKTVAAEVLHQVELPEEYFRAMRQGLWAVVNEDGGTGRNARVANVNVAGKTGTVQVIAQHGWVKSASLPFKFRDHAWFASFAPHENAELVVVVFVEHGGGGGSDAAPLARSMFEAHFRQRIPGSRIDLTDPETLKQLREGELPMPQIPQQRKIAN